MKSRYLYVAFFLLCPTFLFSQAGLNSPPISSSSSPAGVNQGRLTNGQTLSLTGKVTAEDGTRIDAGASVILECGGAERGRVNADTSGDFSMPLTLIDPDPATLTSQSPLGTITIQDWNQCELYGDAPGYTSDRLRMFGSPGFGVVRAGTVIMRRLARTDGSAPAIDVASLAAPEKAKKAFEKGQEQVKKGKWAAACDYFRKAVQVYPRYALAWLELGRTQLRQNDFTGAQQSFHQATEQDPHSIDAFVQIAKIAIEQHQWKELADSTGHIVQLAPDATARFWYLNSAANFNLGNIPQAETSATRALRMDSAHEVPQLEYLYSMILARRGDYDSAISHMKTYLELSPHGNDSADAQSRLTELEKLADAAKTASR